MARLRGARVDDPPENASMRRVSVDKFEVVIDKQSS